MGFFQAFLAKSQRRHALDILCKVTKECTLSTSVIRVGSICSKLGYTQKIAFKDNNFNQKSIDIEIEILHDYLINK